MRKTKLTLLLILVSSIIILSACSSPAPANPNPEDTQSQTPSSSIEQQSAQENPATTENPAVPGGPGNVVDLPDIPELDLDMDWFLNNFQKIDGPINGEYTMDLFTDNTFEFVNTNDTLTIRFMGHDPIFDATGVFETIFSDGARMKGIYQLYNGMFIFNYAMGLHSDTNSPFFSESERQRIADHLSDVASDYMGKDPQDYSYTHALALMYVIESAPDGRHVRDLVGPGYMQIIVVRMREDGTGVYTNVTNGTDGTITRR